MHTYTVYWIRLPEHTDYNTEGYIGITKHFEQRMVEHKRGDSGSTHLSNAITKHSWDNLIKQQLVIDLCQEEALLIEESLRPTERIGWNIRVGGDKPPTFCGIGSMNPMYGKTWTEAQRRAHSDKFGEKHPHCKGSYIGTNVTTGETIILTGGTAIATAGFSQSAVWRCANGHRRSHKGYTWTHSVFPLPLYLAPDFRP